MKTKLTVSALVTSLVAVLGCDPADSADGLEQLDELDALADVDELEELDRAVQIAMVEDLDDRDVDPEVDPHLGGGAGPSVSDDEPTLVIPSSQASYWTTITSNEYAPLTCHRRIVEGVNCSGSYCNNIQLRCGPNADGNGHRHWSDWFSEEGSDDYYVCPGDDYFSGIACRDSFCDEIAIECQDTNLGYSDCHWSGWYSEEDGSFSIPAGYYIKGVRCNGSYCDEKKFYYCQG